MAAQTLQMKPVASVAAAWRIVRSPLKVPAWAVVTVMIMAGLYGYVAGRQNPIHHYVPYVGYPLVLDTTTGTACYSTQPKPSDDTSGPLSASPADATAETPTGPTIPMCGKR